MLKGQRKPIGKGPLPYWNPNLLTNNL